MDGQTYTRCIKALHPKREGEREDERYLFLSENYVKSDNNIILVNVSVWKKGMIISGNFPKIAYEPHSNFLKKKFFAGAFKIQLS